MAIYSDKRWHRSETANAVAPVAVVRGLGSSCSSVMGGTTALRGLILAAPTFDTQLSS